MLAVGTYLADRYEILNKIGAGGMSDVYKAKDHILGRCVAVKVLKAEFSEDRSFVAKFRTEAQSAAGLEHPNIVNIYDVGSEDGLHYIVMEHVEGITLKTYIEKKGQLSFKESASIAIQVARGIEAAHNKQIIHRDIKPQNIMISTEGKVKVMDFGIAKAASSNTISSDVMGSVHYASPEQARNGYVDGRSDIYSLGIVMYEMVTGRVPFDGDTTVSVAIQHLQEEIPNPAEYAKDLPVSMEKIILKCTQKNPDRRYQNIGDLLNDLRKSLVNPEENFVAIAPAVDNTKTKVNAKTKVISAEELKQIKDQSEEPAEGELPSESMEEEGQEDEDEDREGLSPKLDKAVTIMGIVVAAIILIVIIYLIGSVFDLFRFGKGRSDGSEDTESQNTESEMPASETEPPTEEKGKQVAMISLLDMTREEAKDRLDEMGLYLYVIASQKSDKPQGTILDQDVAEGTMVDVGTVIKVIVAGDENVDYSDSDSGEQTVTVQSVVDRMEADAVRMIEAQGLLPIKNYDYSDTVEAGKVISQNPSGGTSVAAGSRVTIVISQGKKPVTVPSVLGYTKENAVSTLEGAGLTAKVAEAYSDSVEAGKVISQSVASSKTVPAGTEITITVSLGPETILYSYSDTFAAPDDAVHATYSLVGSNGATYDSGDLDVDGSISISAAGMECSSGTVTITWTIETVDDMGISDISNWTETHTVDFTKQ